MPDINDFHKFKHTSDGNGSGGSGGGKKGGGFGLGWLVIVIVAISLGFFIASGAGWGAIDTLLGLGFIAFLFVRKL